MAIRPLLRLEHDPKFEDPRTRMLLDRAGIRCGRLAEFLPRLLDFAVDTRWGKRLPARAEVLATAA